MGPVELRGDPERVNDSRTPESSRRVTVLMGGPDAERPVSLDSGGRVAEALRETVGLDVSELVIDRPSVRSLRTSLDATGTDIVFPVLHGPWGEGGVLQRMLEEIDIPFVGSGSAAAEAAMDKMRTKSIARAAGVPTPPACLVGEDGSIDLDPPFVIKPTDEGSSVGVRLVRDPAEAGDVIAELRSKHATLMAERYVAGRELTVSVLDGEALPPVEIEPAEGFYDYEAKYLRNDTRYTVSPPLPPGVESRMASHAVEIFDALGCRDLARVDWLIEDGGDDSTGVEPGIWMLEVNTIPGMTAHSLAPMAAAARGIHLPSLCRRMVDAAAARARR